MNARISEIFCSLQGEGVNAGERQVFVRFAGCNLWCVYCDTAGSLDACKSNAREFSVDDAVAAVRSLAEDQGIKTVCVTGGEPLLQAQFLELLLPRLKEINLAVHLETNGTLPKALKTVLPWCDIIAMDIKLPSATGRSYWREHAEFLLLGVKSPGRTFVKIVLQETSTGEEFKEALELIKSIAPRTALVLQPAAVSGKTCSITSYQLSGFLNLAKEYLEDVRFIPQMHKLWGLR